MYISACTEYYLEDVIQMLNFVPPLPEKKKKRDDVDDDEEVRITLLKLSVSKISKAEHAVVDIL